MNYVFLIDVSYERDYEWHGLLSVYSACTGILQTLYGAEGEGSGCWPAASKVCYYHVRSGFTLLRYLCESKHHKLRTCSWDIDVTFSLIFRKPAIRVVPDIDEVYPPGL
jgi:hypothetical protein